MDPVTIFGLAILALIIGLVVWARHQRKQWEEEGEDDSCEDSGPHNHNERTIAQSIIVPKEQLLQSIEGRVAALSDGEKTAPHRTVHVEHHHHHRGGPSVVPIMLGQGGFTHLGPHHHGHHSGGELLVVREENPHQAITAQHARVETPANNTFQIKEDEGPTLAPVEVATAVSEGSYTLLEDEGAAAPAPVEEVTPFESTFRLEEDDDAASPAPVEEHYGSLDPSFTLTEDESAAPAPIEREKPSEPTQLYISRSYESASPAPVEREEPSEPTQQTSYQQEEPSNDDRDYGGESGGSNDSDSDD